MMRTSAFLVAALAVLAVVATTLAAQTGDGFPHDRHAGLFPLCTGCHGGIVDGRPEAAYPSPATCARCHDGSRLDTVAPATPTPSPDNLTFSHPEHDAAAGRSGTEVPGCQACHRPPGAEGSMQVAPATAEQCLGCHAHEAPHHLAEERDCRVCHRPLEDSPELTPEGIAGFPTPPSHDAADFIFRHDSGTALDGCTTCHARESCSRCHFNETRLPAVERLPRDPRVAGLVDGRSPEYPTPGSHASSDWRWRHGAEAAQAPATCSNCHAARSCLTCHRSGSGGEIEGLPRLGPDDARGVKVRSGQVHPPGYGLDHTAAAGAGDTCASCHDEEFCSSCHQAPDRPAFHFPGFVEAHGPEAYAGATDCASCHSTEVFCRACHAELGMTGPDRAGLTFHTSQPFWLLGHGIAARQGLAGCVSCHSQADCAACHSSSLGWGVNPHGPAFDGSAMRDANPFSCSPCHLGGGPG